MFKNYFKIAWRNIRRSKLYSTLNIVGLATGMAVAILIGLWVADEVSYDKYHKNYDRLAQVMVVANTGKEIFTGTTTSIPMATELKKKYSADFKYVAHVSWNQPHILAIDDKQISQPGMWVAESFPIMFSLNMLRGDAGALGDPSSVLLSRSVAQALFGDADPLGKTVKIDNAKDMKVAGVYEDLPRNTTLHDAKLLLPWTRFVNDAEDWIRQAQTDWENHMCQAYVQLRENADLDKVNAKIKNVPTPHISFGKEEMLLHPMSKWHLYNEFKEGRVAGGRIDMVRLFAIIGLFVLLLACINFMNLSTAKSEKRGKEVGIRKTIGSLRLQLVVQFLSESVMMACLALVLAIAFVLLALPFFNEIADKAVSLPWENVYFWALLVAFTVITGLISGSYPALYLSAFKPAKVLKGTFKTGRYAGLPRKALVVVQFAVSVALIIGTVVVYKQIQHAVNRPVGYTREGLITVDMNTPDLYSHYDALRNDILQTGAVTDIAESNSSITQVWSNNIVDWKGKDPNIVVSPGTIAVSHDFGHTIGWTIKEGRDFSRNFPSDTFAFILNESAVKMTGFKHPVGKTMRWLDQKHKIIGVVKDMVMESPYQPIRPTIFHLNPSWARLITVRIKPGIGMKEGLTKIEPVFKKYNPGSPFVYKFTDEEYAKKFSDEKRLGNLTLIFAILAVFISCLGLFGLASFVAEQRTKEIGIRKVMGASVFNLWNLLSRDFVMLVAISFLIAVPLSYFFMHSWLQNYQYRTDLSWWIFAASGIGALVITLITVSFQSIKVAIANPVKSLRTE